MGKAIRHGILWTFLGVFPAALLIGMFFRFPVPFRGEVSGWSSLQEGSLALVYVPLLILQATAFYVIMGGFVPLAILGTIAGIIGWRLGRPDHAKPYARNIALGLAFVAALVLSVLENIIGPW
jgi:hypothetical protein